MIETLPDGRNTCHGCIHGAVLTTNDAVGLLHGAAAVPSDFAGEGTHIAQQRRGNAGSGAGISGWLERVLGVRSIAWPPVMIVDEGVLNGAAESDAARPKGHTRGITLTETSRSCAVVGVDARGVPLLRQTKERHVTGMLILGGLPKWQAGSVIAHEATHALLRHAPFHGSIAQDVEEGLCQLVAWRWVKDHEPPRPPRPAAEARRRNGKAARWLSAESAYARGVVDEDGCVTDHGAWEVVVWSIENDRSPIYGGGFRKCLEAYERYGLARVFQSVATTGALPSASRAARGAPA